MKKILVIILAVVLVLSLSLTSITFAAGGKNEVTLAQESGQAWLDRTVELTGEPPEWVGAHLATPQVCYGLDGQPNAYMFTMENDGEVIGYAIVGSSDYGYPVLEAADCPPPSIPSADEARSIVQRDLALEVEEIGKPTRLLYLGFDNLYAVYQTGGQEAAVNLLFDFAIPAPDLKVAMPSPEEYRATKEATEQSRPVTLQAGGSRRLDMTYYADDDSGRIWCGPCSGVSIGRYYRDEKEYGDLPSPDYLMYDALVIGWGNVEYPIWPWNYGYGFWHMTYYHGGYDNFCYNTIECEREKMGEYYWDRVDDINNDWPIAVYAWRFNYPPEYEPDPSDPHWVAMRGYCFEYGYWNYEKILCTDSLRQTDWLWLDWNNLFATWGEWWNPYRGVWTVTIKDN